MTFEEILTQAIAMLQRLGRVSYRALKVQFQLDDALLEILKDEIVEVHQLARDQDGKILVWAADGRMTPAVTSISPPSALEPQETQAIPIASPPPTALPPDAERRSSPYCSAIWSTRPCSPVSSTRKISARWCGRIKTPAPR